MDSATASTAESPPRRGPLGPLLAAESLLILGFLGIRAAYRSAAVSPNPFVAPAAAPARLSLSGTIRLAPSFHSRWPKGASVFVVARPDGGGHPYAVARYEGSRPPFHWTLTQSDAMIAGAPPPRVRLTVLVDQDGDPLTRQLGDLSGGPSGPIGVEGVAKDLVVDREAPLTP